MMAKLVTLIDYAENHFHDVTADASSWADMLDTAAKLYRYRFEDLVMIHAQRPGATALADFDTWNKRMGRGVRSGAKGIGVLREIRRGIYAIKYLFDVEDTRLLPGGRTPEPWTINDKNRQLAEDSLKKEFELEDDHKDELPELIHEAAGKLTPVTGKDKEEAFLRNSIEYVLLKRCGFDPGQYLNMDNAFSFIHALDSKEEFFKTGAMIMTAAGPALHRIGRYVVKTDQTEKEEESNGNQADIPLGGGRAGSGFRSDSDEAGDREVRHDEEAVSEGVSGGNIRADAAGGDAFESSAGRAGQSDRDDGVSAAEDDEGRGSDGGAESGRYDGMGRQGELHQGADRGDHQGPDDLHLTADEPPHINFAAVPEPEVYRAHDLTKGQQEALEAILRHGGGRNRSRLRIAYEYMSNPDPESLADFLKEEIRACTKGVIVNGRRYAASYSEDGLKFIEGNSVKDHALGAVSLSWKEVESCFSYLFNRGAYASQLVLDSARENAVREAANAYVEMQRELDTDVLNKIFGEDVLGRFIYPEVREKAFDALKEPQILERICEKVRKTEEAYREDPEILRFSFCRPSVILKHLERIRRFSLSQMSL